VHTESPLATAESRESVKEDLSIIKNGLHFINDLLRSMLDMHRAASNQMKIVRAPTDLMKDVFEPVASMLYRRGEDFEVLLECPENLMVSADRLRLTQIVLDLGRNAAKFVTKGFVRLRAEVVEGNVQLSIEDSGPGIPESKRKILFSKFQESLDSLNQGTGIGLCLCKNLIDLMEGEMWLDEIYHSGVENCPGARFVLNLNVPPLELDSGFLDAYTLVNRLESCKRRKRSPLVAALLLLPLGSTAPFHSSEFLLGTACRFCTSLGCRLGWERGIAAAQEE
jgi:signal transduction histidine kinase